MPRARPTRIPCDCFDCKTLEVPNPQQRRIPGEGAVCSLSVRLILHLWVTCGICSMPPYLLCCKATCCCACSMEGISLARTSPEVFGIHSAWGGRARGSSHASPACTTSERSGSRRLLRPVGTADIVSWPRGTDTRMQANACPSSWSS